MVSIPTTLQLYNSILSDLEAELGIQTSPIGRVFVRALAAVQAAKLKLFYLSAGFLQKNIFADTADKEELGGTLQRFGRVKLNRNPFPAVAGHYDVDVTGSIGAVIPAQTTFKSNDDSLNPGKLFVLDVAYTLVSATDTISLRSLTPGLDASLEVADRVTVTSPVPLLDSEGVVTAITIQPQAEEDIETYRDRVVEAYRLEPQGGAPSDYRLWAADVQGVRQSYAYATSGQTNEVDVFVEAIDSSSTPVGSGIPPATMISDVEDVIDFDPDTSRPLNERGRRPTSTIVNVYPITPKNVEITITGYVGLTPAIQTSITNAMTSFIDEIRPFVAGADVLANANDILSINGIIFTIQDAVSGSNFTGVSMLIDGVPSTSQQFLNGDIPKLLTITFV